MRKNKRIRVKGVARRRGAVALEYILICAFMAIALMGAFIYFRRTASRGSEELSKVAEMETNSSIKEIMDAK